MKLLRWTVIIIIIVAVAGAILIYTQSQEFHSGMQTEVKYFCGYERCKDSPDYGKLINQDGIMIWNSPEMTSSSRHMPRAHGDKTYVIGEERVSEGPGGLWYLQNGGGWINEQWLTDEICTPENLEAYSFTDCENGEY